MTKEELNAALYRKLKRELDRFRESFLALPQDELLNRAYEYVVRRYSSALHNNFLERKTVFFLRDGSFSNSIYLLRPY